MSLVYDMVYAALATVTSPLWGYKLIRTGKWRTDWPGRFGKCTIDDEPDARRRPTLLIHAVSVGEVDTTRLLVRHLVQKTAGQWRIIVASITNTGVARAKSLYEPQHTIVRYPFDLTWAVRRFLDTVGPDLVALVENEVWPNLVSECQRRRIPVCVINGRMTERSYRRYRLIAPVIRRSYGKLAAAAVQTEQIGRRFSGVGTPPDRVTVLDTMKWDTTPITDQVSGADELARAMGIDRGKPLIVAGSTGPGEEKMLINTCPADAQLVIAPRKPERFDEVAQLAPMVRRSEQPDPGQPATQPCRQSPAPSRLFLLDTIGELAKAYSLADVVIVGRSFLGQEGSNVMEPIALGKPTIVGPFYSNFADVVEALKARQGIEVTTRPGELAAALLKDRARAQLLAQRGREVIRERQGATDRHVELLMRLMADSDAPPKDGG